MIIILFFFSKAQIRRFCPFIIIFFFFYYFWVQTLSRTENVRMCSTATTGNQHLTECRQTETNCSRCGHRAACRALSELKNNESVTTAFSLHLRLCTYSPALHSELTALHNRHECVLYSSYHQNHKHLLPCSGAHSCTWTFILQKIKKAKLKESHQVWMWQFFKVCHVALRLQQCSTMKYIYLFSETKIPAALNWGKTPYSACDST